MNLKPVSNGEEHHGLVIGGMPDFDYNFAG